MRHPGGIHPQMALCAGQTLNTVPPAGQVRHCCQCSLRLNLLPSANFIKTVTPRRRAPEQISFLGTAGASCHQLAGIPEYVITVRDLVDGEVALKHTARRPK